MPTDELAGALERRAGGRVWVRVILRHTGREPTPPSNDAVSDTLTIPALAASESISLMLEPFEVLNIASDGEPGDMTGTVVEADQAVAVFTRSTPCV